MNRQSALLIGLLAIACAGCGPSVTSVAFLSPPLPPRDGSHPIQLYQDTQPECPYQEVGTIVVQQGLGATMTQMTEGLRRRAREMGGDAVVKVTQGTVNGGGVIVGATVVASNEPVISGTVIRFRDSTCTR